MRYFLHGSRLDSDLALPLLRCDDGQPVTHCLRTKRAAELPCELPGATVLAEARWDENTFIRHLRDPAGYLLQYARCHARVSPDLRDIELTLAPGLTDEEAGLLVVGGLTAFILSLRGRPPLHASAVGTNGRAVAFLGESGAGKSTLAALFCLSGWRLLADDLLALDGSRRVLAGAIELRLRPAAAALAHRFPPADVRLSVDGRHAVRCAAPFAGGTGPRIDALVAPKIAEAGTATTVVRLGGAPAFLALAASPRQLGLKDDQLLRNVFQHFGAIAQQLPVFEARFGSERLRDTTLAAELRARLEAQL